MEAIRVLCISDGDHDSVFVTSDQYTYSNVNSFITHRLAQPHNNFYEVRGFHLYDHKDIPGVNKNDAIRLFDIICGYMSVPEREWYSVFETLWNHSSERWYV